MHLKKVVLRDFRCFEEFEIDLHPRLTVLVAENGGGKTAVLDGIAIGLSSVLRYLSSANQRLSGPGIEDTDFRLELRYPRPQLMLKLGDVEEWGVSDYAQVVIETTAPDLKWDYWRPSATGKLPAFKTGQSDLAAYASGVLDSLNTPTPQLLPVFAYYGARRGWIVIPERLRESKVDYTHPTSALVGALESLSDFKEMLKWFDVEEAAELRANKGRSSEDYDASSALSGVRSAISAILGGAFENPHFNRKHKFVVESQNGSILQVSQLSQGYQSMLAQGMDFARRLALANSHLPAPAGAPAIMLVDEIDLHLHPSWQQRVLGDLMRAFPNTQFIVTTHSPQVLSTVPMESIRIIKDGTVYAAPPGTDGAEAQRILEDVFQVSPRPKTRMSDALDEYLRLVDAREWAGPRALELRQVLDKWSQGHEPRLFEADLQIANMKWEAGE
ncbi:MAG: AAA family ATPase [Anaerolineae bacterium]